MRRHLASNSSCFDKLLHRKVKEVKNAKLIREETAYYIYLQKRIYQQQRVLLLYDADTSKKADFPCWNYEQFDLVKLPNDECKALLHFFRNDIYQLVDQVQLPEEIVTYNGLVVGSIPALCTYLRCFAYPCWYGDMVLHFAGPVPELCIITNHMIDWIYNRRHHFVTKYNHDLPSQANLPDLQGFVNHPVAGLPMCLPMHTYKDHPGVQC